MVSEVCPPALASTTTERWDLAVAAANTPCIEAVATSLKDRGHWEKALSLNGEEEDCGITLGQRHCDIREALLLWNELGEWPAATVYIPYCMYDS